MTSTNQVRNAFIRHVLFAGTAALTLILAIVLSAFVLFGGLSAVFLWAWAVFAVAFIAALINIAVLMAQASSDF
jgi:hypothetical protein